MKRILCYIAILAAMWALPVERADVGKLRPVETVAVYNENDWIVLRTDTDDVGIGNTALEALANMKTSASGIIYLDTAEYLLLTEGTQTAADELRKVLKDNVKVCFASEQVDLAAATKYLSVHTELPKLKDWKEGMELPVLLRYGERFIFSKKVENSA